LRWETIPFYAHQKTVPAGLDRNDDASLSYFKEFNSLSSSLQEKITALLEIWEQINTAIEQLSTCSYRYDAFAEVLRRIQEIIDRLNLEGFSNLAPWVSQLERRIQSILIARVTTEILAWCANFQNVGGDELSTAAPTAPSDDQAFREFDIKPLVHEIRIRNQVLYLEPPLESAKAIWVNALQELLGVICNQRMLKSTRYELTLQAQPGAEEDLTYRALLWQIDEKTLRQPLLLITEKMQSVREYVEKWLRFQALWDLDSEFLYERLGDSLSWWAQLLTEIRQTRSTFDTSETRKEFGVCVIDYTTVQSKVNTRYDSWQREILLKYGQKLGTAMRDVLGSVVQARHDLEQQSIEGTATAQAVVFITFMQELKRKVLAWAPQVDSFITGQQILERQRFPFPGDWLHADQLQGEWVAFNEIMQRKDASIQEQLSGLQLKVIAGEKIIDSRVTELQEDWESNK
jgi:dynein heavy chain 1